MPSCAQPAFTPYKHGGTMQWERSQHTQSPHSCIDKRDPTADVFQCSLSSSNYTLHTKRDQNVSVRRRSSEMSELSVTLTPSPLFDLKALSMHFKCICMSIPTYVYVFFSFLQELQKCFKFKYFLFVFVVYLLASLSMSRNKSLIKLQ